eukprot:gnl/TRDRNA2_/TRDRNA2_167829_c2_seq2.p1 gnl/TRDRNA2_/TRDRNA2_167829_c2~~gnl/TRDRNA2_/TRDRNA2_167829_c2_seq2.p1  ORF type:complete len:344 (-),score=51.68 gnl/TRDRNA2_/TRDRNA2_167829_c2_seq2:390-1421(-)
MVHSLLADSTGTGQESPMDNEKQQTELELLSIDHAAIRSAPRPLPSELVLWAVEVPRQELFVAIVNCFVGCVTAEIHESSATEHKIRATIFLDWMPVDVEVKVNEGQSIRAAVAVFAHPSRTDIVRFHHVAGRVKGLLREQGLKPTGAALPTGLSTMLLPADDLSEIESAEDWAVRLAPLLLDISPTSPLECAAAAAAGLAQLVLSVPACRLVVAAGLLQRMFVVGKIFDMKGQQYSLAVQYPMAAVVKQLSSHDESAALIAQQLLPVLATLVCNENAGMPHIVKRDLLHGLHNLCGALVRQMPTDDTLLLAETIRRDKLSSMSDDYKYMVETMHAENSHEVH